MIVRDFGTTASLVKNSFQVLLLSTNSGKSVFFWRGNS
jgi:hypothetical protein